MIISWDIVTKWDWWERVWDLYIIPMKDKWVQLRDDYYYDKDDKLIGLSYALWFIDFYSLSFRAYFCLNVSMITGTSIHDKGNGVMK